MLRRVEPEWLDELPAAAPEAIASRGDLQRLNWWMGHAGVFHRALRKVSPSTPRRVVELGAGDGTFLLRLAARWPARGARITTVLVDRQNLVSAKTRRTFAALGWDVQTVQADVFDWLAERGVHAASPCPSSDGSASPKAHDNHALKRPEGRVPDRDFQPTPAPPADWLLANLFLHHFPTERLRELLALAAVRTSAFIVCEPRRAPLPLAATRLLGLIGCNAVTRHDARVSVRAGFAGEELSALWPSDGRWELREIAGGLFSHCFVARLKETPGIFPAHSERPREFSSASVASLNLRELPAANFRECSKVKP